MTRQKHTIADKDLVIIGESANINYFLNTPLSPDSAAGVTNKQGNKKACTRRRYSGDPSPSNVSAHAYEYMVDPGRIDLQTLPGKSFILDDGTEKRQFTFQGTVMDLHAFLAGDAAMEFKLYTSGAPYVIAAAEESGALTTKTR